MFKRFAKLADVAAAIAGVFADFASAVAGKGDALITVLRSMPGAIAATLHDVLETRHVDPVVDFGVPNTGLTDATPKIQAMLDALAAGGKSATVIFPPGDYLLRSPASETGEPRSYAAAVILRGLSGVTIRGSKGTRFIQDDKGLGAPQFAMFRFERCLNVELYGFEADGSGIDIHTTGAARSSFAFICNHDLDTKADLAYPNRLIHIHHLKLDNFGGGICSATRTEAGYPVPLVTQGVNIHDIVATNISGQNHFVGLTYTESVHVHTCNVKNPLTPAAHIGNTFADMSAGVVNAVVENNYAVGFTGGCKAETHVGAGVGNNEDRPSQNVTFRNNTFEQIGDPTQLIYSGPGGGGWYGIKLNGINHAAYNNTITARSVNMPGSGPVGGLYQGIQLTNTSVNPVETLHSVWGNDIRGPVLGINHDSPSDPSRRYVANIFCNKIRDTVRPAAPVATNDGTGIVASRNALVRDNDIYRTKYAAVMIQSPDQTVVRDNFAYNCGEANVGAIGASAVFIQAGSGAQGYFEFSNNFVSDTRGAAAAKYGYFLEGGTTYANRYACRPGLTEGLVTAIFFDMYVNALGDSRQLAGTLKRAPIVVRTANNPALVAPWNAMAWIRGDRAELETPTVGSARGWICTADGVPGTWVSEGNL